MSTIASRELRNNTKQVLDRVSAGESVTITVRGKAVATLVPNLTRTQWLNRRAFVAAIQSSQADAALTEELDELLAGELTDDNDLL